MTETPMTKILIAIMSMEIGGAETHVLELCKALQKKGMQVYVASNGGAYEPELAACGVIHYKVPLHNKQLYNMLHAYRALKNIISENDIRLVHAHSRIPAFLCGFLQRRLNFRFVTTAHWVFTTQFPYNLLSNWGEKSLAVSADIKDYLINHYQVPSDDIYITINGVDTDKFSPDASFEKHLNFNEGGPNRGGPNQGGPNQDCLNEDGPRIMSVSRLDQDRSLVAHLLIESAPALVKRYPNMQIYILGGGDDYDNVYSKAEKMNAELNKELNKDVIIMSGPQVDVHKWLSITNVFVGASRAVLEAMAVGKPVVAAGNEGYLGLLHEENLPVAIDTNFCYRGCGDATADKLTRDLITILDMPEHERALKGQFGREFVLANYSVDRMADDALELYKTVLSTALPVKVKKTDIMISGYYGNNNSGDDLLLKAIVGDLQARKCDLSITVLSKNPKETTKQYGVNAIYRFNFFAIWRLLRRTKLLLTGGGSVIQDLTSTHSLIYYLWIIRTARRLNVKNMLYANGIGPIKHAANVERVRKELKMVDLITLREDASRAFLEENHITGPKIKPETKPETGPKVIVTADPVFSLPAPDFAKAQAELKAINITPHDTTSPGFFCIAIRSWRYNPPGFERHIADFADYIAQKYKLTALFISMQPSDDTEISKKTMALMKTPAVFLENPRNMDSIRGIVGQASFTLAMRLHTLIYAINCGVPVIGLVYDPKVERLMESIGQTFYANVEDVQVDRQVDKLKGFADEIMANAEEISAKVKEAGRYAQGLAEQNADLCIGLLE